MTAEIAILNRSAVALAADSAMSYGSPGSEKIYPVSKLFTLSKYFPVGIMIYNNANFMGVPLETIIKMYRETAIGQKSAPTIREYTSQFLGYLTNSIFCTGQQQADQVYRINRAIFESISNEAYRELEYVIQKRRATHNDYKKCIYKIIDRELISFEEANDINFQNPINARLAKSKYKAPIDKAIKTFDGYKLSKEYIRKLHKISELSFIKDKFYEQSTCTGIVIAGFGEDEIFPTVIEIEVDGVVDSNLRSMERDYTDVSRDSTGASILPFAQDEMVHRFMQGIDNMHSTYLSEYIRVLLYEFGKGIIDVHTLPKNRRSVLKGLSKTINDAMMKFHKDSRDFRWDKFISPILYVVEGLPKEELAHMAEALINLTSVKRRVSAEKETVGGPVDVAVISKGDGFIWIKRKQYFSSEFNPTFNDTYLSKGSLQEDS